MDGIADKVEAIANQLEDLARQVRGLVVPPLQLQGGKRRGKAAMRGGSGAVSTPAPYPTGVLVTGDLLGGKEYVPASANDFNLAAGGPTPFSASGDPAAGLLLGGVPDTAVHAMMPMVGGAKKRTAKGTKGAKPSRRK